MNKGPAILDELKAQSYIEDRIHSGELNRQERLLLSRMAKREDRKQARAARRRAAARGSAP